jgi:hypothetical protein
MWRLYFLAIALMLFCSAATAGLMNRQSVQVAGKRPVSSALRDRRCAER